MTFQGALCHPSDSRAGCPGTCFVKGERVIAGPEKIFGGGIGRQPIRKTRLKARVWPGRATERDARGTPLALPTATPPRIRGKRLSLCEATLLPRGTKFRIRQYSGRRRLLPRSDLVRTHSIEDSSSHLHALAKSLQNRRPSGHGVTIPIGYMGGNFGFQPRADGRLLADGGTDGSLCSIYKFSCWSACARRYRSTYSL